MGIQWSTVPSRMMKSILFATLVAAASAGAEPKSKAEAKPFYGYPGMGFNFNGYPYFYGNFHGQYPHHFMGKRSADAEAFYGPYGYGSPYFGGYGSHSYNSSPSSYGHYSYYH